MTLQLILLLTSSLLAETAAGYNFGQIIETYSMSAAHGYFGRLIFQYAVFNLSTYVSASFFKKAKFLKILISDREIPVKTTSFSRFPY